MIYLLHFIPKLLRVFFNPLIKATRSILYDSMVVQNYTEKMNQIFLNTIPDGATILDIGIGTGTSMTRNAALIKQKRVVIDGIDVDADYIATCEQNIKAVGLEEFMTVTNVNIYEFETEKKYDYVLFSDSYAVIPEVHNMIEHSKRYLKPNGQIIILTTLEDEVYPFRVMVKPRIVYFTMVEFGKVTTKAEFVDKIENENKLRIDELKIIVQKSFPWYGQIKSYMAKLSLPSSV